MLPVQLSIQTTESLQNKVGKENTEKEEKEQTIQNKKTKEEKTQHRKKRKNPTELVLAWEVLNNLSAYFYSLFVLIGLFCS